jgi:hypothetical protein
MARAAKARRFNMAQTMTGASSSRASVKRLGSVSQVRIKWRFYQVTCLDA